MLWFPTARLPLFGRISSHACTLLKILSTLSMSRHHLSVDLDQSPLVFPARVRVYAVGIESRELRLQVCQPRRVCRGTLTIVYGCPRSRYRCLTILYDVALFRPKWSSKRRIRLMSRTSIRLLCPSSVNLISTRCVAWQTSPVPLSSLDWVRDG